MPKESPTSTPDQPHPNRTPTETYIDALKSVSESLGKSPTAREFDANSAHSARTLEYRFGSWNEALRAADLSINLERFSNLEYSKDDVRNELTRIADELGRTPTREQFQELSVLPPTFYKTQYDTFNLALEDAGLTLNRATVATDELLLKDMRRVAEVVDALPTPENYDDRGKYQVGKILDRFITWDIALFLAELTDEEPYGFSAV